MLDPSAEISIRHRQNLIAIDVLDEEDFIDFGLCVLEEALTNVLDQRRSVPVGSDDTGGEVMVTDSVYADGNFALGDADSRRRSR